SPLGRTHQEVPRCHRRGTSHDRRLVAAHAAQPHPQDRDLLEKGEIVWKSQRGAYLIVPAEKSKNHQPLSQPLTDYSKLLLRLALKHSGDSSWVMPGKKNK